MSSVICQLAGQWADHWPALDRGLQYGDGLFETIRLDSRGGMPLREYHFERLQQGLQRLYFPSQVLDQVILSWQQLSIPDGATGVKLLLTRGEAARGYAIPAIPAVNLQWQFFTSPEWRWKSKPEGLVTGVNPVRLGNQPLLAGLKHLNRLEQVLARQAFQPGWDESLMLDQDDLLVEGCMSNLYWIKNGTIFTPSLAKAGVNGVIRRWLSAQRSILETDARIDELYQADLVFMSNALNGLVPIAALDGQSLSQAPAALAELRALQSELEACF